MQYRIVITTPAKADIFEIKAWLLENRREAAEKWLWGLSEVVASLKTSVVRINGCLTGVIRARRVVGSDVLKR